MTTIIAGRFEQQDQVEHAVAEMVRYGFSPEQISSFYVNPPGQHAQTAIGGDRDKSPGAKESTTGTAAGMATGGTVGAAVGAATAPVTGPLGAMTGAFVGAHIGSLVGTLSKMDDNGEKVEENRVPVRQAGMVVAVSALDQSNEKQAIEILRSLGAEDIERTEGTIIDGDWKDFDPISAPALVENQPARRM